MNVAGADGGQFGGAPSASGETGGAARQAAPPPRIVQGDWQQCDHDWQLDFTGHTLMWRCTHCQLGIEARSSTA